MLPFAWNGLVLHAAGASALRVRLVSGGPTTVSLEAADETGGLVVTVDSLVSRPVSAEQLDAAAAATRDALFRVDWTELSAGARGAVAVVGAGGHRRRRGALADVPAVAVYEVDRRRGRAGRDLAGAGRGAGVARRQLRRRSRGSWS